MKHLLAVSGLALATALTSAACVAESAPPTMPALSVQQSQEVTARMDAYRRGTEDRVARNEITQDEAARLLQWREWQIARQVAGAPTARVARDSVPRNYLEPAPSDYREDVPPDYRPAPSAYDGAIAPDYREPPSRGYYVMEPAPYYRPYVPLTPYYYGPRSYGYWGTSICAGGFGRHFGGRICF